MMAIHEETIKFDNQDALDARRASENRAQSALGCPWCGSEDGMQNLHRDVLTEIDAEVRALLTLYALSDDTEYLYHPCTECRRAYIVPVEYVALTDAEVGAWLEEQ